MSDSDSGTSPRLLYFVLGTPDSGRRELLRFLVSTGFDEQELPLAVLLSAADAGDPRNSSLLAHPSILVAEYAWDKLAVPETARTVALLADPLANPIDQIEAVKDWLDRNPDFALARVFTVVDARLASSSSKAREYYEACAWFADAIFLGRREDVSKKWIHDYQEHFRKECYPCLFELLKKDGRIADPLQVLFPEARRLSQFFDPVEQETASPVTAAEVLAGFEDDEMPELSGFDDDEEVISAEEGEELSSEPYLERDEAGRRRRPVPCPRDFLSP